MKGYDFRFRKRRAPKLVKPRRSQPMALVDRCCSLVCGRAVAAFGVMAALVVVGVAWAAAESVLSDVTWPGLAA